MANAVKINKDLLEANRKTIDIALIDLEEKNKALMTIINSLANDSFKGKTAQAFIDNNTATVLESQIHVASIRSIFNFMNEYCEKLIQADNFLKSSFDGVA